MPFPISCAACGKSFSIPDDVYDRRVAGKVVSIKCKACRAPIRVDGTQPRAGEQLEGVEDALTPPPAPLEKNEIWAVDYGEQGDHELSTPELLAEIQAGNLGQENLVWKEGMENWKAVAEVEELRGYLPRPTEVDEPQSAPPWAADSALAEPHAEAPESIEPDQALSEPPIPPPPAQVPFPQRPDLGIPPARQRLPTILGQPPPPMPSPGGGTEAMVQPAVEPEPAESAPPQPPAPKPNFGATNLAWAGGPPAPAVPAQQPVPNPSPAEASDFNPFGEVSAEANPFFGGAPERGLDPFGTPIPGTAGAAPIAAAAPPSSPFPAPVAAPPQSQGVPASHAGGPWSPPVNPVVASAPNLADLSFDAEALGKAGTKRPLIIAAVVAVVLVLIIWIASSTESEEEAAPTMPAAAATPEQAAPGPPIPTPRHEMTDRPSSEPATGGKAAPAKGDFAKVFAEAAEKSDDKSAE